MAYADPTYPLMRATPSNYQPTASRQDGHHGPPDDPVRIARNNWVAKHTNDSDSSDIIDSIDVDMIDAHQDERKIEIYVVLDTNILIHSLAVLKQIVTGIQASNANLVLLVPGIVVSELDYQKNSTRDISTDSRRASDWLAGEIGSGRGHVKGQAYTQTMLPSGDWRQRCGLSNDELILDCCKYFGHVKRKDVLLCTSDNNLAVQAYSNATNLFIRGVNGVIRPSRELGDWTQLIERAVPGFAKSSAASIHASGSSHRRPRGRNYSPPVDPVPSTRILAHKVDDAVMEIDMDDPPPSSTSSKPSPGDLRDELHKQIVHQLVPQLRRLTGQASNLQEYRRKHESIYSPDNARFKGSLPTESDWSHTWTLRECLKFIAKIPPPRCRTWTFGEGEASSLADFLGLPGERGARPGREWSRYDWGRELMMVQHLAEDFGFEDLDSQRMAEYHYEVMAVFAVD